MSDPRPEPTDELLALLEAFAADPSVLADLPAERRRRLLTAAGRLSRPDRAAQRRLAKEFRRRERDAARQADAAVLERTGIRRLRHAPVFPTPVPFSPDASLPQESSSESEDLTEERKCYVCKQSFRRVHFFYDAMCDPCAEFNWEKRHQTADLSGRVALVTGGRVKIGYQAVIKLLRAGASAIVTTRFPHDAALRYAREPDFADWRDRLSIYGLDLRHTPSVEALCRHLLRRTQRLDFIINNACQTVRRPPGFYDHLMEAEHAPLGSLPADAHPLLTEDRQLRETLATHRPALLDPVAASQVPLIDGDHGHDAQLFPAGQLDSDLQQVDLRGRNSWRLGLAEVSAVELLEVHLVNAVAPFVLNARLKALMLRQRTGDQHIVNVSAMEGQFYREFKTDKHPHTNMAKAALNMMTRTSAVDYARDGIHMNSVDTGWVTDEDPVALADRKRDEHGFSPPLDIVDGAARILDPIFSGVRSGNHLWGLFLKDYRPAPW